MCDALEQTLEERRRILSEPFRKMVEEMEEQHEAYSAVFHEDFSKDDNVNHPSHYCQGGIECIDAIKAATINLKGIEAVDTGNVIKYVWRWKDKNGVEDLKKARWYIDHLIKEVEQGELDVNT